MEKNDACGVPRVLSHVLKQETKSCHEALEAHSGLAAYLASQDAWLWLLGTFHGCGTPIETALHSSPGFGERLPDSHLRFKADLPLP